MREIFPIQRTIEQIDIADIKIDVRSRDDIPLILLGLQHIYCTEDLREKVFEIIKEMLPTRSVVGVNPFVLSLSKDGRIYGQT